MMHGLKLGIFSIVAIAASLSACSAIRGPGGLQMYDGVVTSVVVKNAIFAPTNPSDEELAKVKTRIGEFINSAVEEQGSLKVVEQCGPRTARFTYDLISGELGSSTDVKRGFFGGITSTTNAEISVTMKMAVVDCVTGAKFNEGYYTRQGSGMMNTTRDVVSNSVSDAYSVLRKRPIK